MKPILPEWAIKTIKTIEGLTPGDRAALDACMENPKPTERVHIGSSRMICTHYRFWRLLDKGLALTMPPRLTTEAVNCLEILRHQKAAQKARGNNKS